MVKNYGIHDVWTDLDKVNDVDIKAVDGVIDSIKVNGEEAGGGGNEYPLVTATWHDDLENYTYSCNWSFAELKTKIEETAESYSWAGVALYEDQNRTLGGSWSIGSETRLTFRMSDGFELIYHYDGTITEGI